MNVQVLLPASPCARHRTRAPRSDSQQGTNRAHYKAELGARAVAARAGVAAGPRRGGAAVARQGRALRQHAHAHRERDSGSVCRCGADGSRAASSAPCTMMSCAGVCGEFVFGDYAYLQQRCSDLRRNDAVCDLNVAAISGEDEEDSSLPHLPTQTPPDTGAVLSFMRECK